MWQINKIKDWWGTRWNFKSVRIFHQQKNAKNNCPFICIFVSIRTQIMKVNKTYLVHPETKEQASALKAFMEALKIKFEISKDDSYNPEFVAKIEESKKQYENGDFMSIEKKDINKFLELN